MLEPTVLYKSLFLPCIHFRRDRDGLSYGRKDLEEVRPRQCGSNSSIIGPLLRPRIWPSSQPNPCDNVHLGIVGRARDMVVV